MARKIALVLSLIVMLPVAFGVAETSIASPTPRVEPGVLSAARPLDVLVRFRGEVPPDVLALRGLQIGYRFGSLPALAARATPGALRALAAHPDLAYLESNKPVEFELDSATKSTRAREVWSGADPIRDANGTIVDGSGVGIAIVDTGLDGLHADFAEPSNVAGNYIVTPAGLVSASYTSTVNHGHGTHVAGIAAGSGEASGGIFKGAAPGASLYSFNIFVGAEGTILLPAIAFDWILQEGAKQSPPIRVVNNSWRCGGRTCGHPFNGDQLHIKLASKLAESGVVVTWSAGNDAGTGTYAMTNTASINPAPGIISVANYNDERGPFDTGVRDHIVAKSSSRGDSRDPRTWPDLAAPGTTVGSAWAVTAYVEGTRPITRNPVDDNNQYVVLSGTSMAAPHVAGIVAMMFQANPALRAGEVEYLLKATATKLPSAPGYLRADPAHPYDGANYVDGHGLVDARAAVLAAASFAGVPEPPAVEPIPEWFVVKLPGIDIEHTLYLTDERGMSDTMPPEMGTTHQDIHQVMTFESPAFTEAVSFDAVHADLYLGTLHEYVATTHANLTFRLELERLATDGPAALLASVLKQPWNTAPGVPWLRRFPVFLPSPVSIDAGERLRMKFVLERKAPDPAPERNLTLQTGGILMYTGRSTPSRLGLGHAVARPEEGSAIQCRAHPICADIGGEIESHTVTCGAVPTRLTWAGPAASMLVFSCEETTVTCVVPGMPGDPDGVCEVEFTPVHPGAVASDGLCAYRIPDGAMGGRGRCQALEWIFNDR